jgi:hypothetical protein
MEELFPTQAEIPIAVWGNCESSQAVIYEGKALQVAIQIKPAGNATQAVLFLRVCGPAPLENLECVCPPDDMLNMSAKCSATSVSADSPQRIMLMLRCRKPFPAPACAVQLRFTYNGQSVTVGLKLPIFTNHFVSPATPNKEQFVATWQRLADKNTTALVDLGGLLSVQQVGARISSALKMSVLEGVSPNAATVSCCGTFNSIGVQGGQPITMPLCLVVDVHPSQPVLRLAIRTGHPGINQALCDAFVSCFRGTKRP